MLLTNVLNVCFSPIAVLKKVRYEGESYADAYALCPMPYALCPMPYEHLMLLRKAIQVLDTAWAIDS